MWSGLTADFAMIKGRPPRWGELGWQLFRNTGFQALGFYRIGHFFQLRGLSPVAGVFHVIGIWLTGADIHPAACIADGVQLCHSVGTVIGSGVVIDQGVRIYHQVTLGAKGFHQAERYPHIERDVELGAGAKVLGGVIVGRGAILGANTVVVDHVSPYTVVVGIPGRPIRQIDPGERILQDDVLAAEPMGPGDRRG